MGCQNMGRHFQVLKIGFKSSPAISSHQPFSKTKFCSTSLAQTDFKNNSFRVVKGSKAMCIFSLTKCMRDFLNFKSYSIEIIVNVVQFK